MTKRKSSAEQTRVYVSKDSSGNFKHSRLTIPSPFKGVQTSGKSVIVMASKVSKSNLKNVDTNVGKIPGLMEKNIPKTKLSTQDESHDRRSPSPRLKNFPAEKIKKIDGDVLLKPHNEPTIASFPEQNIGHGDALNTSQQIQITPRHQPNNVSKSQQNISYFFQIDNSNKSEVVFPTQKGTTSVIQSHRPFVPNTPHASVIQEQTPKKQVTPRPIASHMPSIYPADLSRQSDQDHNRLKKRNQEAAKSEENQHQESPQVNSEIFESDYGKQPVGGRVAALHRQAVLREKPILPKEKQHHKDHQEQQHEVRQQNQLQQSQPQQNQLLQSQLQEYQIPQQPNNQQAYQPIQNNAAHQQHMQQRAMLHHQHMMNQMQQRAYYDHYNQKHQQPSSGMTSPQDLSINRQRYHQMQKPVDDQVHSQTPVPNNKDNPNVRAQLNPFTIDLIHKNSSQFQSNLPIDCQKTASPDHVHSTNQYSPPTDQNIQRGDQNNQQQKSSTQEHINHQGIQQQKQTTCKKVYVFTPQMLKDQEVLVAAMQQQQVPEDVMQRQFQLLLSEQKKQLAYLDALSGSEEKVDEKSVSSMSKKVTKLEVDEKPDWMSRITPPRIPYCEIEKAKIQSSGQKSTDVSHQQQVQQNVIQHQQQVPHQQQIPYQPQVQHQQNVIQHQQPLPNQQQVQYHQNSIHHQLQAQQQARLGNQVLHQQQVQQQQFYVKNQVPCQLQFQHQANLPNQVPCQHQAQQQRVHSQNQILHQHQARQQAHLQNLFPHQLQVQQQAHLHNQIQHQVEQQQAHLKNQVSHQQHVQYHQNMVQHHQQNLNQHQHQVDQQHVPYHQQVPYHQNMVQQHQQNQHHMQQQQQHPQHMMNSQRLDMTPPHFYRPHYHPQYYQQTPKSYQHMWQNWQQSSGPSDSIQQHTNFQQSKEYSKTVEPSSLLKLRQYKEVIQPQKRNNGLQDPDTVKEALEALKNAETKKGLEYLTNLNKKEQVVRLNGIQEPGEIPENLMQGPPPESLQQVPKKVSANGLENRRNPDNPPPPPTIKMRRLDDQIVEYPRIKRSQQSRNYTHIAERENGSVDPMSHHHYYHQYHQHPQVEKVYDQEPMRNWYPENIQQQQFYKNQPSIGRNGQGEGIFENGYVKQPGSGQQNIGTPCEHNRDVIMEIQQPKIIGGVSFLARKSDSIPNAFIPAETSNGNNYISQM